MSEVTPFDFTAIPSGIAVAVSGCMRTKTLSLLVSIIIFSACNSGSDQSSSSTTQALTAAPEILAGNLLANTWVDAATTSSDTMTITSSGLVTSSYCHSAANITSIEPSSSCPSGADACGSGKISVYLSDNNSGCVSPGVHDCTYIISADALSFSCGGVTGRYVASSSVPNPSPSPSPSPSPTEPIIGYTTECTASGCVQVPIYGTSGGCLSLSSPIYFVGSGQILGSVLAAGAIPGYSTYGSLAVSSSPVTSVGGTTYTSASGLQINVANTYAGSATSVSGALQLSQAAQYNILMTSQGYSSYPYYSGAWGNTSDFYGTGYGNSSACVSGIALQLASYSSVNGVYGYAYLYLNNTQHGYVLQLY